MIPKNEEWVKRWLLEFKIINQKIVFNDGVRFTFYISMVWLRQYDIMVKVHSLS